MEIRVRHTKGKHYANLIALAKIYWASLFGKEKSIYLFFYDKSKYDLKDEDIWDWNKAIGRGGFKHEGGTRKEEQFIVWRYIPSEDEFHVAEYKRENYQMILPKTWQTIKGLGVVKVDISFLKSLLPLGGYFGGNETPPNNLTYKIIVR